MRELRRENRALRRELRRAAAHRYGSFTPGVAEWEAEWDASPGRRVLFYAPMDLAGSLVRWATAVHRHTAYAVRVACLRRHPFGYELDLLVATTPDLCFPWFEGRYVPLPVDADRFAYSWTDGDLVAHSPSIPERKATADLVAAVRGLDCRLDVITGVSYTECLERKRRCNLFFDQAGRELAARFGTDRPIGWYANSALEAAVHGIPAIAHLAEESFAGALRGGQDIAERCAILNTHLAPEDIRETILRHLSLAPAQRQGLSRRTRRWIEEFHSYPAVAGQLRAVYDSLS